MKFKIWLHKGIYPLAMQKFYDLIGLKKRDGKTPAKTTPARGSKAGNAAEEAKKDPGKTSKLFNTVVDIATMVKRLNINYNESNGTVLPGYTQSVGFIGTARPTLGFVLGSQSDVRFEAARRGWLTDFDNSTSSLYRLPINNLISPQRPNLLMI